MELMPRITGKKAMEARKKDSKLGGESKLLSGNVTQQHRDSRPTAARRLGAGLVAFGHGR